MSDTNERSVASAGSVAIAWAAVWPEDGNGIDCGWVYDNEEDAIHAAAGGDGIDGRRGVGTVVPLYRSPTLTDAEREAVDTAEASLMRESTNRNTPEPVRQRFGAAVNTLRGLLERTK